jgi:hypothetical protein
MKASKPRAGPWAALVLAASVVIAACQTPVLVPTASAALLSSRGRQGTSEEGAGAVVCLRVSVTGSLAVTRFGLTVSAKSDRRQYWKTELVEERLPPSSSVILDISLPFDSPDEDYVEGSAVMESSWFE